MSANTYHAREGVSVQAELYKFTHPQIVNTIVAGRTHYLVTKDRRRVEIQPGDFIIRGDDGQVDAMPAALFHQLFEMDLAAAQAISDVARAEDAAAADRLAAEAAEADAQAEPAADAEDAAAEQTTDEPPAEAPADPPADDEASTDPSDDAAAEAEAQAAPKKTRRRRKKTGK